MKSQTIIPIKVPFIPVSEPKSNYPSAITFINANAIKSLESQNRLAEGTVVKFIDGTSMFVNDNIYKIKEKAQSDFTYTA
ncbi:hypothetical protein II906_05585 [bacterium]|nr:hypothetical protein [bacterium]